MPYVTTTEVGKFGRGSRAIDLAAFATDLAKALGAKRIPQKEDHASVAYEAIDLGDKTHLNLYSNNWKAFVDVSISATDVKHGERSVYDKAQKTQSATVNPDGRKIEAIAKDIRKRVIDANAPALAAQRAHRDERRNGRNQIALLAGRLKELLPVLDIRKRNDEDEHVTIYCSSPYLSAQMSADGKVRVERIESMDMARFVDLFRVIATMEVES